MEDRMTPDAESVDVRPVSTEDRATPLGVDWIHGSVSAKHNTDPDMQVHWYDEHTVILRQNKAINYEAPFMFLLFGGTRAVLIDTGATASPEFFPLRTRDRRADVAVADAPSPRRLRARRAAQPRARRPHCRRRAVRRPPGNDRRRRRRSAAARRTSDSGTTPTRSPRSISAAGCWTASPRRATTRPRSRSTTAGPGSC